MDTKQKIAYWLDIAQYDLVSAEVMLKGKRFLHVGFMCHQVAEKCLKAYFWHTQTQEPPHSHHLIDLSRKSGFDVPSKGKYSRLFEMLMPMNIEARYPEDKATLLKKLNTAKSRKLFEETKELYAWIKKLLR